MSDWKVGDNFIVAGPESELKKYAWCDHPETQIGTIHTITEIGDYVVYCAPFKQEKHNQWYIKLEHMSPVTKLHKALL